MSDLLQSTRISSATSGGRNPYAQHPLLPHPDADQLNAFVERVLPEHERLEMIGHLADCSECREIVALSLPPLESDAALAADSAAEDLDEGLASRPLAARLAGWFSGWKLVWIAAPALAALVLLTVHLRNQTSGPRPAATTGQVADAHQPAPAPPAPALPKIAPAPAPPPVAPPETSKAPAQPSVPAPPPAKPAMDEQKAKAPLAPAPAAKTSSASNRAAPAPGSRVVQIPQAHTARVPAAPLTATGSRSSHTDAFRARTAPNQTLSMQSVPAPVQTAQGASSGGPLRRQSVVRPATPSFGASPASPSAAGGTLGFIQQPPRAVPNAAPAEAQSVAVQSAAARSSPVPAQPPPAQILQSATGGVATVSAAETAPSAASSVLAAAAPVTAPELNVAAIPVNGREVPEAAADVALTRNVYADNQSPLPSALPVLSQAANLRQRLALDTRNQLFLSTDDGQHWKVVFQPWKSRAISVANVLPTPAASAARTRVLTLAVPERYTPGAAATVQSGEQGGTLSGAVTDATGAAIPGAIVVATDSRTALSRTARADAQGHYLVDELPPGVYRLDARAYGFAAQSQIAALGEAQQSVNNIALAIGQSSQTVTVETASSAQLETSSPTSGRTSGFALSNRRKAASSSSNKPAAANRPPPLFLLTTDSGERWTSPDGIAWSRE